MILLLVFLLWLVGFLAHEVTQPRSRKLIPLTPPAGTIILRYTRFILPGGALTLCLRPDWQTGLIIWLSLGACAGTIAALSLAIWRHKHTLT